MYFINFKSHVDFLIWLNHVLFNQSFTNKHLGFLLYFSTMYFLCFCSNLNIVTSCFILSSQLEDFSVAMTSSLINTWICQMSMLVDSILVRTDSILSNRNPTQSNLKQKRIFIGSHNWKVHRDILASGTVGSRGTNIVIRTQVSPSFGSALASFSGSFDMVGPVGLSFSYYKAKQPQ